MAKEIAYDLERKYMTQEEVALLFRVSPSTVKNWRGRWISRILPARWIFQGALSEGFGRRVRETAHKESTNSRVQKTI